LLLVATNNTLADLAHEHNDSSLTEIYGRYLDQKRAAEGNVYLRERRILELQLLRQQIEANKKSSAALVPHNDREEGNWITPYQRSRQ